jgi:hypothetical protein
VLAVHDHPDGEPQQVGVLVEQLAAAVEHGAHLVEGGAPAHRDRRELVVYAGDAVLVDEAVKRGLRGGGGVQRHRREARLAGDLAHGGAGVAVRREHGARGAHDPGAGALDRRVDGGARRRRHGCEGTGAEERVEVVRWTS